MKRRKPVILLHPLQKNDREKLILLKYFKEKKTLNGGKKTVEIAEVNM